MRQATPTITVEDVVLFDPAVAYRSPHGVTLLWWLADAPQEAKLEILDRGGEVPRNRGSPM